MKGGVWKGQAIVKAKERDAVAFTSMRRTPRLWEQLSDGSGSHRREKGTTVHGAKVREEPHVVELVGNNGKAGSLRAGRKEVALVRETEA